MKVEKKNGKKGIKGISGTGTSFISHKFHKFMRYLEDAEAAYEALEQELVSSLVVEVEQAVEHFSGGAYRQDPWLWNLDWRPASTRSRSGRLLHQIYANRPEFQASLLAGKAGTGFPAWFQVRNL